MSTVQGQGVPEPTPPPHQDLSVDSGNASVVNLQNAALVAKQEAPGDIVSKSVQTTPAAGMAIPALPPGNQDMLRAWILQVASASSEDSLQGGSVSSGVESEEDTTSIYSSASQSTEETPASGQRKKGGSHGKSQGEVQDWAEADTAAPDATTTPDTNTSQTTTQTTDTSQFASQTSSTDPNAIYQWLLQLSGVQTNQNITPDQLTALENVFQALAQSMATANQQGTSQLTSTDQQALTNTLMNMISTKLATLPESMQGLMQVFLKAIASGLSIDNTISQQQMLTQLETSPDADELFQIIATLTGFKDDMTLTPEQKTAITNILNSLTNSIAAQNASGLPSDLQSSDPATIKQLLLKMTGIDTDQTIPDDVKNEVDDLLGSLASLMASYNSAQSAGASATPSPITGTLNAGTQNLSAQNLNAQNTGAQASTSANLVSPLTPARSGAAEQSASSSSVLQPNAPHINPWMIPGIAVLLYPILAAMLKLTIQTIFQSSKLTQSMMNLTGSMALDAYHASLDSAQQRADKLKADAAKYHAQMIISYTQAAVTLGSAVAGEVGFQTASRFGPGKLITTGSAVADAQQRAAMRQEINTWVNTVQSTTNQATTAASDSISSSTASRQANMELQQGRDDAIAQLLNQLMGVIATTMQKAIDEGKDAEKIWDGISQTWKDFTKTITQIYQP